MNCSQCGSPSPQLPYGVCQACADKSFERREFIRLSDEDQLAFEKQIAAEGAEATRRLIAAGGSIPHMTRRPLVDTARALWSETLAKGITEPGDVTGAIWSLLRRRGLPIDVTMQGLLTSTAFWCESGFPQVSLSARHAASLMATAVPGAVIGDVALPWDHYAIEVPPGTLTVNHPISGAIEPVDMVFLSRRKAARYAVHMFGNAGTVVQVPDRPLTEFAEELEDTTDVWPSGIELSPMDYRAMVLASRLAVGAAITLDSAKYRHRIEVGSRPPRGGKTKRGRPVAWAFQLTDDVRVDCREWVRSFLRGGVGSKAAVQTLVRGHHKRQAHGPGGSLRKWIHVEPYWRGPDDAPIAVRSHQLPDQVRP